MPELCDVYDSMGNKTGEFFYRGDPLKSDQYFLAANIWVFNSASQVLLQKRAQTKLILPGFWATHGGVVGAGETSFAACIREAYEETGIKINPDEIWFLARHLSKNLIMDNYIVKQEFDITTAVLQKEEVSDIKWATIDELKKLRENHEIFEYPEFFSVIGFIENQ